MLRDRVREQVESLSEEENISSSKVCAMLIEEALIHRGTFDNQKTKMASYGDAWKESKDDLKQKMSELDDNDLKMIRKLKMLKELEIL